MKSPFQDADYILVCDGCHALSPHPQWRQVSHVYEQRVWYNRNDGLPGFAGAREEPCSRGDIKAHIPGGKRSLSEMLMYHAPVVCRQVYGTSMLRKQKAVNWWLYIPKPNATVDTNGSVCPYIHRAWVQLTPLSKNCPANRPNVVWTMTLKTHFESATCDEICFRAVSAAEYARIEQRDTSGNGGAQKRVLA